MKSSVDVVMRYHKTGNLDYLFQAIESLAQQTFPHIHLILSTQDIDSATFEKIKTQTSEINRKSYRNIGLTWVNQDSVDGEDLRSQLFLAGLSKCQSDYIAFLDYDDILYPYAYELLVQQFERHPKTVLIAANVDRATYNFINGQEICLSKNRFINRRYEKYELCHHNVLPLHSYMIRRSALQKVDLAPLQKLSMFEDYSLILMLMQTGDFDFSLHNCSLGEYKFRMHLPNSTLAIRQSEKIRQQWIDSYKVMEHLKTQLVLNLSLADLKKIIRSERKEPRSELGYDFFDFSPYDLE